MNVNIPINWSNTAQSTLEVRLAGKLSWKDCEIAAHHVAEMVQSVNHDVYIMLHFEPTFKAADGNPFPYFRRTSTHLPANIPMIVSVETPYFAKLALSTFINLTPNLRFELRFADSLHDAELLITNHSSKHTVV